MKPRWSHRTIAIHGAHPHEPADRPVAPPIYQTSTFEFASSASLRRYNETGEGYLYTRHENPSIEAAEDLLAGLEGAEDALLFASGMAAIHAVLLSHVKPGEGIASMRAVYGGTYKLISRALPALGIRATLLDTPDMAGLEKRIEPGTRLLFLETPTNPTLDIVDIEDVARRAHALGLLVVVDNTFATPILQNPLALGADLVVHSATKYLGGHSDVVGGVVCGPHTLLEPIENARRLFGGSADPFAAWLLARGLRTLAVRIETQTRNAEAIAPRLASHPKIERVLYPGLPSHPGHEIATRQMRGPGAMLSIEVRGGLPAAERAWDRFRLVLRAVSLGSVETLASLPLHTSHTGYSEEELARAGVSPGMIRLSIGLEDSEDILADFDEALAG